MTKTLCVLAVATVLISCNAKKEADKTADTKTARATTTAPAANTNGLPAPSKMMLNVDQLPPIEITGTKVASYDGKDEKGALQSTTFYLQQDGDNILLTEMDIVRPEGKTAVISQRLITMSAKQVDAAKVAIKVAKEGTMRNAVAIYMLTIPCNTGGNCVNLTSGMGANTSKSTDPDMTIIFEEKADAEKYLALFKAIK